MGDEIKSKNLGYGAGALVIFAISLGTAVVVYGGGVLTFNPLDLTSWILSSLGVYTIIYTFVRQTDALYYASWGLIMLAIGLASALYGVMNPLIILGLLLIVLAIIGLIAYWRRG